MKVIYVASPLAGDVENNLEYAREACRAVVESGHAFFAPHLLYTSVLNDLEQRERKLSMQMGLTMLEKCDELWAFGNDISNGMALEIRKAEKLGIPVYHVKLEQDMKAEGAVRLESSKALEGMSVRAFLEAHPASTLDLMTPGGYMHITPVQGQILLAGDQVAAHAGFSDSWRSVDADEILDQVICTARQDEKNPRNFSMLTAFQEETETEEHSPAGMEMPC